MYRKGLLLASLAAALLAAVCAHVGIDILGDWLVRDDAYDHVAHASRLLVTFVAVAIAAIALLRLFTGLCDAAAQSQSERNRLLAKTHRHTAAVALTMTGATLCFVPAMELFDALQSHSDLDDLSDLFGGSLLLGVGVTIACAVAATLALMLLATWICRHQDQILATFAFTRSREVRALFLAPIRNDEFVSTCGVRLTRKCPKRGPPALASAGS